MSLLIKQARPLAAFLATNCVYSQRSIVVYTHRSGRREKEKEAKRKASGKLELKTPKGTRDYGPEQMVIRKKVIDQLTKIFESHGAEAIDTPVFELKEVLLGKYGEEGGKLVYDLADQGGELCSLRYDLTVPFARFLAMNNIPNMKRYHIAKVYRRDNPAMSRGRYREFYQCDFDIAGDYELMLTDAECLKITDQILSSFQLGEFEIRVNHRVLLEGMFSLAGIKPTDFKTVCSSVDKLDKVEWEDVKQELVNEKKIEEAAVDNLKQYVLARKSYPSNEELFAFFESTDNENIKKAVKDLRLLLKYCAIYKCDKNVAFEPSLARGLDYYTATIYEAVITKFSFDPVSSSNPEDKFAVGSVAAGGRYDKLVGMFQQSSGKKKPTDVPCVGISFGIERLFSIMEAKADAERNKDEKKVTRTNFVDVYVASAQKKMMEERMKLCTRLWDAGLNAEHSYKPNPKMLDQFQYAEDHGIPIILVIGNDELNAGCVKLRITKTREETNVKLDDLVEEIKERLGTQ
ncbi:Histidine--tRNA ligase [Aphelenchoides bicaudatus]|nr:Histidine--tRNA ligase [Aphelenchoides bicaudatus]